MFNSIGESKDLSELWKENMFFLLLALQGMIWIVDETGCESMHFPQQLK